MTISSWSIRNPIPVVMLFVMLIFGGLYSFKVLQIQNLPDLELPTITVTASLPGASPSQLETDVARKMEGSICVLRSSQATSSKLKNKGENGYFDL